MKKRFNECAPFDFKLKDSCAESFKVQKITLVPKAVLEINNLEKQLKELRNKTLPVIKNLNYLRTEISKIEVRIYVLKSKLNK